MNIYVVKFQERYLDVTGFGFLEREQAEEFCKDKNKEAYEKSLQWYEWHRTHPSPALSDSGYQKWADEFRLQKTRLGIDLTEYRYYRPTRNHERFRPWSVIEITMNPEEEVVVP